jgi:hypothetical protein
MNQSSIRSFLRNLWRRWPITIVTTAIAVPIASWSYMHMSDSSRLTARAYAAEKSVPAKPSGAVLEANPSQAQAVTKKHRALPAFRRVEVGGNEVDYVAEDVTVRIFTPAPKAHLVQRGSNQVDVGDDVTVHYFADNGAGKAGGRD